MRRENLRLGIGSALLVFWVMQTHWILLGILRRDTDNQIKTDGQFTGLCPFKGLNSLMSMFLKFGSLISLMGPSRFIFGSPFT